MNGRRIEHKKWKWDVKLFKPIELTSIFLVNLGLQTVGKLFDFLFFSLCISLFIFYFNICILPILQTEIDFCIYIFSLYFMFYCCFCCNVGSSKAIVYMGLFSLFYA